MLFRHTIVGIISTTIGICIIIGGSYLYDSQLYNGNIHTPTIIMIVGLLFMSFQRVYEEWLNQKIETSTYRFIGLEGLYGLIFGMILQLLISLIYLNTKEKSDIYNFLNHLSAGKSMIIVGKSNKFNRIIIIRWKFNFYYICIVSLSYSL